MNGVEVREGADVPRRRQATGRLRRVNVLAWAALFGGLGATLIAVGSFADGYESSLMLEVGSALFLAIPLVLVEDVLEAVNRRQAETEASLRKDLRGVKRDVQEARTRIEVLGEATADRIAATRASDSAAVRAFRDDASELNAWRLLRRAQDLAALDPRGARVRLPGSTLRARFRAERSSVDDGDVGLVLMAVEDADGERLAGTEAWSYEESADEALSRLADELQSAGRYPGDASFDAEAIFNGLADTVGTVVALRTGGIDGAHLAPVIELEGDWALTVDGLAHIGDDRRRVPARLLLSDRDQARATLSGADEIASPGDRYESAIETALSYHSGEDRRAARSRLEPPA
jgi:hypothetical protein